MSYELSESGLEDLQDYQCILTDTRKNTGTPVAPLGLMLLWQRFSTHIVQGKRREHSSLLQKEAGMGWRGLEV